MYILFFAYVYVCRYRDKKVFENMSLVGFFFRFQKQIITEIISILFATFCMHTLNCIEFFIYHSHTCVHNAAVVGFRSMK